MLNLKAVNFSRFLTLFLVLTLSCPNPALALRAQATVEAGLEEDLQRALADPDPFKTTTRTITNRLAQAFGLPSAAPPSVVAGLEELPPEAQHHAGIFQDTGAPFETRRDAFWELENLATKLREERFHEPFFRFFVHVMLNDPDVRFQKEAAFALGVIAHQEALDSFAIVLEDPYRFNPKVQIEVLDSLVVLQLEDEARLGKAVSLLERVARNPGWSDEVRGKASAMLGEARYMTGLIRRMWNQAGAAADRKEAFHVFVRWINSPPGALPLGTGSLFPEDVEMDPREIFVKTVHFLVYQSVGTKDKWKDCGWALVQALRRETDPSLAGQIQKELFAWLSQRKGLPQVTKSVLREAWTASAKRFRGDPDAEAGAFVSEIEAALRWLDAQRPRVDPAAGLEESTVQEWVKMLGASREPITQAEMEELNRRAASRLGDKSIYNYRESAKELAEILQWANAPPERRADFQRFSFFPPSLIQSFSEVGLDSKDPITHAALVHWMIAKTQPFGDGNYRTGWYLMNALLLRSGDIRRMVEAPEARIEEYLELINRKSVWEPQPFVKFIREVINSTAGESTTGLEETQGSQEAMGAAEVEKIESLGRQLLQDPETQAEISSRGRIILGPERLAELGFQAYRGMLFREGPTTDGGHLLYADSDLKHEAAEKLLPWLKVGRTAEEVIQEAKRLGARVGDLLVLEKEASTREEIERLIANHFPDVEERTRAVVGSAEQIQGLSVYAFQLFASEEGLPPVIVLSVAIRLQDEAGREYTLILMA